MTTATYTIEVAWTSQQTSVFIIGTSVLDGTDELGGDFGVNTFDVITPDVKSVEISRGRSNDMSSMQQGVCTLILKDPTGKYNPWNSGSALNGYLIPLRPLRIYATYSGTDYQLFTGFISRIEYDPYNYEATIEAVDLFEWLNTYSPTIAEQTDEAVEAIIKLIVDSVGYSDPTKQSFATGGLTIPSWEADGSTTCLGLIETLLGIDLGVFYISAGGVATYKTRNLYYTNEDPAATLSGSLVSELKNSIEIDSIINGQYVLKTGGVATFATNTASRKLYGYRNGNPITSALLESDSVAGSLANFIVALNANPRSPSRGVTLINRDETTLLQQLTRDLTDCVAVTEPRGDTSFEGRIQGIRHSITHAGKRHETSYMVQQTVLSVFTIGESVIDGADILGF